MKKISLYLFLSFLILNFLGCGKKDSRPEKPQKHQQTDLPLDIPEEQPDLPPDLPIDIPEDQVDPAVLEKLDALPRLSLSFDNEYRDVREQENFWKLTANNRASFYNLRLLKIAKFYITNYSDQNVRIRLSHSESQGVITQYLNKWHAAWTAQPLRYEGYGLRMKKEIELGKRIYISLFSAKNEELSPDLSYEFPTGERITGYLMIDFYFMPRCDILRQQKSTSGAWEIRTQWDLYRLEFQIQNAFRIQKSLSDQGGAFYKNQKHWIDDVGMEYQRYHHKSDFEFDDTSFHFHTAQSLDEYSREQEILDFNCDGLY